MSPHQWLPVKTQLKMTQQAGAGQRDAEGQTVKTSSWWDGAVHKTRMEGGRRGAVESWRSVDAGLMVVKTTLMPPGPGKEVSVLFYLEEMSVPGAFSYFWPHASVL